MQRARPDQLRVTYDNNPSWGTLRAADWVFFLRPCTDLQLKILDTAKALGVKVWVDYDDDLFSLTPDNPSHQFYAQGNIRKNIETALSKADAVSVTTKVLKTRFSELNKKIHVVPNAYDPVWDLMATEFQSPQQNTVLWRGTGTHNRDLADVASQLIELSKVSIGAESWFFVGANPWFVTEKMKGAIPLGSISPITTYFKTLIAIKPKVFIAPLSDTPFNRAKSCIAALEAIAVGAVCVAPAWEEWSRCPNVIPYEGLEDFSRAVGHALALTDKAREDRIGRARYQVSEFQSLSLGNANEERWRLLGK